MRSAARPADSVQRGAQRGAPRWDPEPGDPLRGWRAGSEPSRAHLPSGPRGRFLELREPARRPRASGLPRVCRDRDVRARAGGTGGGGSGSRGCGRWDPTLLQGVLPDPRLCSSSKLHRGRMRGVVWGPPSPGRGAAALRRGPRSQGPVVRTGCSGGRRETDPHLVTVTLESWGSALTSPWPGCELGAGGGGRTAGRPPPRT